MMRRMFPHAVTVYNTESVYTDDFRATTVNHIAILRGVLLDASEGANVRTSGLVSADSVNLYIPFDVAAVDGKTGAEKQYISPIEFWKLEDKSKHWTLSVEGNGGLTFFIQGDVVEDASFETISAAHDHVYKVTKVDAKNFGALQHWEVGGK